MLAPSAFSCPAINITLDTPPTGPPPPPLLHAHHAAQVEVLTQQTTKMFRKCEARLKQFGAEPSASAGDDKVKRNVQVRGSLWVLCGGRRCGAVLCRGRGVGAGRGAARSEESHHMKTQRVQGGRQRLEMHALYPF